jgi:DNA polymerase III subunit delta'
VSEEGDDHDGLRHPRETTRLYGQSSAEAAFLDGVRSGRLHHAWLIGGPQGIGKATLAYRIARFMLATRDPSALAAMPDAIAAGQATGHAALVTSQGHPDFSVIDRRPDEKGKTPATIPIERVQDLIAFFRSTAAFGGWRVAIVDSIDEMNRNSTNALLKVLEEPPARSLFLIIAHQPGQVLPTIRSRCRRLMLPTLTSENVVRALADALDRPSDDPELVAAAAMSGGSVASAFALIEPDAMAVRGLADRLAGRLPALDWGALHDLGERVERKKQYMPLVIEAVRAHLSARLDDASAPLASLARVAEVWDKVGQSAREAQAYNLDRKPLVFQTFTMAAEALSPD